MDARKAKEVTAFWLIILVAPLVASTEKLGLMFILVIAIGMLMLDNFKEAMRGKK